MTVLHQTWTKYVIRSTAIDSTDCAHTCITQRRLGIKVGMDRSRLADADATMAWSQKAPVLHTPPQMQRGVLGLTVRAPQTWIMHGESSENLAPCCLHMGRAVHARLR